jgi:hypothetical protein
MPPHYTFVMETIVESMLAVRTHAKYDDYSLADRQHVLEGIGLLGMMLWQRLYTIDHGLSQEAFMEGIQQALLARLLHAHQGMGDV